MSIEMVVASLIGGRFALAANLVAFTMIDQINQKAPEGQKVHLFFWGTEINKKHRAIYPDSKLVSVMNGLTWLTAASFLVLCWFVLH
jgi:predicted SpoU family rRNA methylase